MQFLFQLVEGLLESVQNIRTVLCVEASRVVHKRLIVLDLFGGRQGVVVGRPLISREELVKAGMKFLVNVGGQSFESLPRGSAKVLGPSVMQLRRCPRCSGRNDRGRRRRSRGGRRQHGCPSHAPHGGQAWADCSDEIEADVTGGGPGW